jgi:hypothetical protein
MAAVVVMVVAPVSGELLSQVDQAPAVVVAAVPTPLGPGAPVVGGGRGDAVRGALTVHAAGRHGVVVVPVVMAVVMLVGRIRPGAAAGGAAHCNAIKKKKTSPRYHGNFPNIVYTVFVQDHIITISQ